MRHPDWNAVAAYLDGRLSPRERAGFLKHLLACRDCRRDVEELSYLRQAWELAVDAQVIERGRSLCKTPGRVTPLPAAKAHR